MLNNNYRDNWYDFTYVKCYNWQLYFAEKRRLIFHVCIIYHMPKEEYSCICRLQHYRN